MARSLYTLVKSRRIAIVALILLAFLLLFGPFLYRELYHYRVVEALRPKTGPPFTNGEVIVRAIERFRTTNGRLPIHLDELVPEYLNAIPASNWGTGEWAYSRDRSGNGYVLAAPRRTGDYVGHVYHSRTTSWIYDQ